MKRRAFTRYISRNPKLNKWLIENEGWVEQNPRIVKQMISRWYQVQNRNSNGAYLNSAKSRVRQKITLPKIDLEKITETTQQLTRTFDMVGNVKSMISLFSLIRS